MKKIVKSALAVASIAFGASAAEAQTGLLPQIKARGMVNCGTSPGLAGFEASCFDGQYVTGDVSLEDFAALRAQRASQPSDEEADTRGRLALQSGDDS